MYKIKISLELSLHQCQASSPIHWNPTNECIQNSFDSPPVILEVEEVLFLQKEETVTGFPLRWKKYRSKSSSSYSEAVERPRRLASIEGLILTPYVIC